MRLFSIPDLLSEEHSIWVFLLVSVAMGGGAAWLTGRALAAGWQPWWKVILAMLALGLAVRFFHFALFNAKLFVLHYYLVDTAVCLGFGLLGFRLKRVRQMVTCYGWINESTKAFGWRRIAPSNAADGTKSG